MQDIVFQLHRFITAFSKYHTDCNETMKSNTDLFPIEVDLPHAMLNKNSSFEDEDDGSFNGAEVKTPYRDSIDKVEQSQKDENLLGEF